VTSEPSSISNDVTLDSPRGDAIDAAAAAHQRVALIEGSTPHMSTETQGLLRRRLRITALLMFGGFLAFLINRLFSLQENTTALHWGLFWDHVLVTVMLGLVGLGLCRECPISLRKLRFTELIVFGCPAIFFVFMDYMMLKSHAEQGYLTAIQGPWIMLMSLYALFIPNTWCRAAWVIGALAAMPLVVLAFSWWFVPQCCAVLNEPPFRGYPIELAMFLGTCGVSAVVGVQTIGTLRRQAFEAKQLGQYRLKHLIGAGGMGEVYLAEHLLMKRPCAVKVVRPEKAGDPRMLARFEREVRSMAKLSHWNTVEIFD